MSNFFVLKVEASQLLTDIRLNGFVVAANREAGETDSTEPLNRWVRPGRNDLRLIIDWPSELAYQPGIGACRMVLAQLAEGQSFADKVPLLELVWPDPGDPDNAYYPYERVFSFEVEALTAPPAALWTDAQRTPWADFHQTAISDVIIALHGACESKNLADVEKILDYKIVDSGQAHYLAADTARASQRELFEYLFSLDDWGMEPLIPENLAFNHIAADQIVWVSDSDGLPALRSATTSPRFSLPLYFAFIKGQWLIVR